MRGLGINLTGASRGPIVGNVVFSGFLDYIREATKIETAPNRAAAAGGAPAQPSDRKVGIDLAPGEKDITALLTPWAMERWRENVKYLSDPPGFEYMDRIARCMAGGVPRMNFTGPSQLQILQPPGQVVIISELSHEWRIIPLDGRPHLGRDIRLYQGDSRGRWEGDTLVVDTTNQFGGWLDLTGLFFSDELQVTERYEIVDANTIYYQARLTDPKVFIRPWTLAGTMSRLSGPEATMLEYACAEGDRFPARDRLRERDQLRENK
jgi:hypothetical protein